MKVVLFGATGMVGAGTLLECLDDPRVTSVLAVGRRPCGVAHPKLGEALIDDFLLYDAVRPRFADADACFFCLGVSSVGMSEEAYTRVTRDFTLAAARSLLEAGARPTFCYISGAGTDSTEHGRSMWARVKGQTENALLALPFRAAYMLRPAYIQPMRGVRSKTPQYQFFYTIFGALYPVFRRVLPGLVTDTVAVGRSLIHLAAEGDPKKILETRDINRLGAEA
ncbi:MAG TPA: epimerase [Thermoanaerobaculia bacterium]